MVISSGILTGKVGYYTPFLLVGTCLGSIGLGLLNTLGVHTPMGRIIGFEILTGAGMGLTNQAPNLAAQTVLHRDEVSIGVSLMAFGQTLFGSIFVSIGQNVLDNRLVSGLKNIIDTTPQEIQTAGTTGLLTNIPSAKVPAALKVYNDSLRVCFRVAVIMSCIAIFGAVGMEWRSMKAKPQLQHRKDDTKNDDSKGLPMEEGKISESKEHVSEGRASKDEESEM
ncbi:hypothetical protein PRZ48_005345 [Zasmidium cellare]|uniref:Uncharacterized protein n=1 Tax=Zasmidium cellare TaxID=395010 RepID=A0ABR0ES62_ZASCE|nr:hypothetical protein PRZ48_005345 [Zasmidium cellare]